MPYRTLAQVEPLEEKALELASLIAGMDGKNSYFRSGCGLEAERILRQAGYRKQYHYHLYTKRDDKYHGKMVREKHCHQYVARGTTLVVTERSGNDRFINFVATKSFFHLFPIESISVCPNSQDLIEEIGDMWWNPIRYFHEQWKFGQARKELFEKVKKRTIKGNQDELFLAAFYAR